MISLRSRGVAGPWPGCLLVVITLLFVASCAGVEEVLMTPFRGETPHERYLEHLERADLQETALALDWTRAAREALASPVEAPLPMSESGWLPPEIPSALGYRVELRRGQRLRITLELEEDDGARVFLEVFRVRGDPDDGESPLLAVAWSEEDERVITYDASVSGTFLVRMQPELLRGGAYHISIEAGASLAFPVEGAGMRDVGSFFGADRDGGARRHHGLDIFAPRGTPVLAASTGRVRRVQTTPIGGRVVWVRNDERGHSEYYAHLDTQLVAAGQRVEAGDTLGLVGNSGNAVTTPPHLHFGIYARGPADPLPYLAEPDRRAAPLSVAPSLFHTRGRLAPETGVYRGPSDQSERLPLDEPRLAVRVLAGSGEWFRIRLPDGRHGFVGPDGVEPMPDYRTRFPAVHTP